MAKKYTIRYSGHSVEMSKPSSTVLVYRIQYRDLKLRNYGFDIPNQFIVYILFGKNVYGKDVVYVGKSKNGVANRPTSHTDKYADWNCCYILTQFKERTFFNDGTIQYLEDKLNKQINKLNTYTNTTETTATGTANKSDEEDCDDYLDEAYDMLYILGLDLYNAAREEDSQPIEVSDIDDDDAASRYTIPDSYFFIKRKLKRNGNKSLNAKMRVQDGKYIVIAGSEISKTETVGVSVGVKAIRDSEFVKDSILQQDVVFDSPSSAASFVIGGASNGWSDWKTEDGIPIAAYRNEQA